jgi:hypothetical protein
MQEGGEMAQNEPRYWLLDSANETNRLDAISQVIGFPVVALADEESGGILAYGTTEIIRDCVEALNARPDDWDGLL